MNVATGTPAISGAQSLPLAALQLVVPRLAAHVSLQVGLLTPCYVLARWGWPEHKDLVGLADTFASTVVFPVLTGCAIHAASQTYQTVDSRWNGTTDAAGVFLFGFLARTLLHIPMQFVADMPKKQLVLMTVHHIVSAICIGAGVFTSRMHFFGCFSGCCEMSTIFLTNLYLFRDVTVDGKELREAVPKWIYALNGALLWLTFFVFRLVLFPVWLYVWYKDVIDFPSETWEKSTTVERYVYPSVIVLLLGLSAFWFFPLTKGLLKAVKVAYAADGKSKRGKCNSKEQKLE